MTSLNHLLMSTGNLATDRSYPGTIAWQLGQKNIIHTYERFIIYFNKSNLEKMSSKKCT